MVNGTPTSTKVLMFVRLWYLNLSNSSKEYKCFKVILIFFKIITTVNNLVPVLVHLII